jgi:hypothetical protein
MNKFLLLTLLVAITLGFGVFYLLIFSDSSSQTSSITAEDGRQSAPVVTPETKPFSGLGSLSGLLEKSEDLECTLLFTENSEPNQIVREGTLFTSRGRLRADVLLDEFNQIGVASVIIRDGNFYSWVDFAGQRTGMQATLADSQQPAGGTGAVSLNEVVNYDCRGWAPVDGSVFEIPTDIIFNSISNDTMPVMEDGRVFGSDNNSLDSCEVCQMMPSGSGRDACLINLGCI